MFGEFFLGDWEFVDTIGQGAFGQVKLAKNKNNNEIKVAIKIIKSSKVPNIYKVKKEICIHKSLNHERIVRFYGYRKESDKIYLFMEYAPKGELYSLIKAKNPIDEIDCIRIFGQLLDGVVFLTLFNIKEYLHSIGITHRDLKLENLLFDGNDNLKIIDFGLSTMFKNKGRERLLTTLCGSPPYIAPEVFFSILHLVLAGNEYKAEGIDIWACGIILYTMFQKGIW
ncbi:hypothetical protein HZS_6587 [Henneguya salminicola]|nr:hypothetical protein HZS_6587 [Henneguya salminicola]